MPFIPQLDGLSDYRRGRLGERAPPVPDQSGRERQIAGRFGLPIHHAAIIAMPVTFDHFVQYGIHRHSIVPGLREVCGRDFLNQFQHHDCRQN
jgi:hypothetical protein